MRNILIILFLMFCPPAVSQTEFVFTPNQFGSFKASSQAQCGMGSVYCMVLRSPTKNEYGNYIYQIYFATNSYFPNCQPARTYVSDIRIWCFDGKSWIHPYNYFSFWITVGQTQLAYAIYHPNPMLPIRVSTGILQPTNY